jgi:hypothetical protein
MRQFVLGGLILIVGAFILSPVVAAFDFDPVPGDIAFRLGDAHINIPVAYSLCASLGLALLYKVMKR